MLNDGLVDFLCLVVVGEFDDVELIGVGFSVMLYKVMFLDIVKLLKLKVESCLFVICIIDFLFEVDV